MSAGHTPYMATKSGDLLRETVGVGRLVPCLPIQRGNLQVGLEPHLGTMDLGPAVAVLNREQFRGLGAGLQEAGFEPEVDDRVEKRLQAWTPGTPHSVTQDSLVPPSDETDERGATPHIESELAATVTPSLELAFEDRRWKDLSGSTLTGAWATRSIPQCGPGASTMLKALAFGNSAEKKDPLRLLPLSQGGYSRAGEEQANRPEELACSRRTQGQYSSDRR